ncbi:uncharacterized protein BYT42DRAFT_578106 [Radiomyces spectabilis]|uniref:uncharacterized protein n=1 Tax=Radiomyces spectabilis TaxID=64574 RepID=UPI00221E4DFF|nr:uncharacterized protein BYT42DRAFT_578106 [Radiomyces spectabilis]KAI8372812.1 hypothetical protein BYT42DRAFT_578106 [Radiomyces spectabilis]
MTTNSYEEERRRRIAENQSLLLSLGLAPDMTKQDLEKPKRIIKPTKPVIKARTLRRSPRSRKGGPVRYIPPSLPPPWKPRHRPGEGNHSCHQCRNIGHGMRKVICKGVKSNGHDCNRLFHLSCLRHYGDNTMTKEEEKDWICPQCRGICVCSFCRRKRNFEMFSHPYDPQPTSSRVLREKRTTSNTSQTSQPQRISLQSLTQPKIIIEMDDRWHAYASQTKDLGIATH